MSLTEKVAEFVTTVRHEDFTPKAIFSAHHGIIDSIACALTGAKEDLAEILVGFGPETGSGNAATIIGRGLETSAPWPPSSTLPWGSRAW